MIGENYSSCSVATRNGVVVDHTLPAQLPISTRSHTKFIDNTFNQLRLFAPPGNILRKCTAPQFSLTYSHLMNCLYPSHCCNSTFPDVHLHSSMVIAKYLTSRQIICRRTESALSQIYWLEFINLLIFLGVMQKI